MSTSIYYFSGTGNSLKVAKDISEGLNDVSIIAISDIVDTQIKITSDRVGIVFPVYVYGLPLIVAKFIKNINILNSQQYIFAISTCRNERGGAILQIDKLLKKKGLMLSAGFTAYMPGNYIYTYDADSIDIQEKKFKVWNDSLKEIIETIKYKLSKEIKLTFSERFIQSTILYSMVSKSFNNWDNRFWIDSNCNGCGICEKICPVNNIISINKKPVWIHKCEQCMACLNWCPNEAIQYTKKTIGKKRYRNPFVNLKEMLKKRFD